MPTFDAAIKTKTRVKLNRDKFSPGMGKLSPSGCETEEALIHGDQKVMVDSTGKHTYGVDFSQMIGSNKKEMVGGKCDKVVAGNKTMMIGGNHTETTASNTIRTIMGNENHVTIGGIVRLAVGAWAQLKSSVAQWTDPASWIEMKGNSGTLYMGANVSIGVVNMTTFIQNTEMYANQINLIATNMAVVAMNFTPIAVDFSAKLNTNMLAALKSDLDGVEAQLGAGKPSLFAATLKGLIAGINQIL